MDSTRWRENEWNIVASQSNNYKENVHRRGHYFLRLWHPRDELHPPGMLAGAPYFISCCFQHADTLRWGYVSSLKWKYIVHVFLRQHNERRNMYKTLVQFFLTYSTPNWIWTRIFLKGWNARIRWNTIKQSHFIVFTMREQRWHEYIYIYESMEHHVQRGFIK